MSHWVWDGSPEMIHLGGFGGACEVLGVKNPKEDDIQGRFVGGRFWDDKDIDGINRYCMRDVEKSAQFAVSLSEDRLRKRHEATMEDYRRRMEEKNNQQTETNTQEEGEDNG